jgi:lipopolysaccharide/colanic/teichoic acid biosynthesis glycosyltransferase
MSIKENKFKESILRLQRELSEINMDFQKGVLGLEQVDGRHNLTCSGNNLRLDVYFFDGLQEGEEIESWTR